MAVKRLLSVLMSGILVVGALASPMPTFAAELTMEQKAVVLNGMNVISGDGTSFQLNQTLKRSEAATFLVKVLGMQSHLMSNAATYKSTGFKDVPATEWYAPYVGYCVKTGIITGYPDGTFKPNESLSEKAFYSMLLKALGYTAQDYDWNTVYRKALEAGISKNVLNAFANEDNTRYLRGQVVDTLYLSLSAKHKNSEKVFIENLIQNNVITKEFAAKNGFMKIDLLPTLVTGTRLVDATTIEMTFNENIQPIAAASVKVYQTIAPTSVLPVIESLVSGNKLTLKTAEPMPSQMYSVDLFNVIDADQNTVASLKGSYTTPALAEVKSALFKISKVEPINLKTFQVTFTQPVTEASELQLLYSLQQGGKVWLDGSYKNFAVKRSTDRNNVIQVTLLTQSMVDGQKYDLSIKGDLVSSYKMNLNNGDGDQYSFFAKVGQSTAAATALTEVYSQETRFIVVELSQKVDRTSALNKLNYLLKEKDTNRILTPTAVYMTTLPDKSGRQVILKVDGFIMYRPYELVVKNLFTEFQTEKISDLSMSFVTGTVQNQELTVTLVQPIDKYTINVHFNRELSTQNSFGSFALDYGLIIAKRTVDPNDPRILKLHLSSSTPMSGYYNYKLNIYSGFTDFSERSLARALQIGFNGSDVVKPPLAVASANFFAADTISVKFNQAIDTANTTGDKFEIYHFDGKTERLIIPEVMSLSPEGIVILKLPLIMAGGTYTLKCKNILDIAGNSTTSINNMVITNDVK